MSRPKLESLGYHVRLLRDDMLSRFDRTPACDRQTDRRTQGRSIVSRDSKPELVVTNVLAAWRSGNVVGLINEVTLRRARLVLGWVIIFGGQSTSVFHQATQANSASYP